MHCFSKASCLGVKLIIITIQEVTGYNIFFIHMIPRLSCQEWCALAAAQVTYLHGWYSGKFTPTPSSLVTSPSDLSQLVHIPLPFSDLIWDAGNLRGYSAYTPPSISYLQVIHSPKHIHPLASPPHALSSVGEIPAYPVSTEPQPAQGSCVGCSAATTIPIKIQDGQYVTEWLRLEEVVRLFIFPLFLHFKFIFPFLLSAWSIR